MPRTGAVPTHGNVTAIGNHQSSHTESPVDRPPRLVYLFQAKHERVPDCNNVGTNRAFSRDQAYSKKASDQDILFELFLLGVLQRHEIPELGDRLDIVNLKHAQVRCPPVIFKYWIVVQTQVSRRGFPRYDFVEHLAQDHAVDVAGVNRESDGSESKLIHHHQSPTALERNRLAAKKVRAPETVFHMPEEGQSRRAIAIVFRAAMLGENTPHHVSINLKAKRLRDDSRDTGIAKALISAFQFDDSVDKFL